MVDDNLNKNADRNHHYSNRSVWQPSRDGILEKTLSEHGISPQGIVNENAINGDDRKDAFFYQADDDHFVPRSVLIEMQPRVINNIQNSDFSKFFNQENIYMPKEECGAGNVWAKVYSHVIKVDEEIMDMLEREADFF